MACRGGGEPYQHSSLEDGRAARWRGLGSARQCSARARPRSCTHVNCQLIVCAKRRFRPVRSNLLIIYWLGGKLLIFLRANFKRTPRYRMKKTLILELLPSTFEIKTMFNMTARRIFTRNNHLNLKVNYMMVKVNTTYIIDKQSIIYNWRVKQKHPRLWWFEHIYYSKTKSLQTSTK